MGNARDHCFQDPLGDVPLTSAGRREGSIPPTVATTDGRHALSFNLNLNGDGDGNGNVVEAEFCGV